MSDSASRDMRIAVVGAGPAGLSAAHYLKKRGYRNVTVLEKLGRVGGLCLSITENGRSFDLGANYVTPSYKETLRLADELRAPLYVERPEGVIQFPDEGGYVETPIIKAVMEGTPALTIYWAAFRYLFRRWRLSKTIDVPGLGEISKHPELCVDFATWLENHDLTCLTRMFEVPITVMGYGYLDEIPAPYALKYMDVGTFSFMMARAIPLIGRFVPWPKRFVHGFGRLFERLSWGLNVRTSVQILSIRRSSQDRGGVEIEFEEEEQVLSSERKRRHSMTFDRLILACPLSLDVVGRFLDLSDEERDLFSKIKTNSYCLTSANIENFRLEEPISCTIPLTPLGTPWAATRQFKDADMVQFYTRVESEPADQDLEPQVWREVEHFVEKIGARIERDRWSTFDRWPYFQHVSADDMKGRYYDRLEALQGDRNTYYTGALLNFELVEKVLRYSKSLVETSFPGV